MPAAVPCGQMIGKSNALHVSCIGELTVLPLDWSANQPITRPSRKSDINPNQKYWSSLASFRIYLHSNLTFLYLLSKRKYSFVLRTETYKRELEVLVIVVDAILDIGRVWGFIFSGELAFLFWGISVTESFINVMYRFTLGFLIFVM
jgi:hypothetical protein